MTQPYLTVEDLVEHETEVKRSRFLCAVAPAGSEEAAREFVAGRRRSHGDATHNCSAYVIGGDRGIQRADDDGEPGGTAGTPMLETLLRRGLSDVVAVVTRYFGGVKLGAGGLVRAYGSSVGKALDRARLVEMVPARLVAVSVDHVRAGRLESDLRGSPYEVREVGYGAGVRFTVAVREADLPVFGDWVATLTAGRAEVEEGEAVHLRAG